MKMAPVGKWRLPATLVRDALAGHSALGLSVAALLYIVALTGTVAMFVPELDRWQERQAPAIETVTPALAAQAVAALPGGAAQWRRVTVEYPTETLPRLIVTARPEQGEPQRFVADDRGQLAPRDPPWSDFLVDLHERLTIPGSAGLILVGLLGVAMVALVLGGVLAHPRLFRDAFLFRSAAADRTRQADLHNRLSVWPLPFHLAIAFTGAALGLSLTVATFTGTFAYQTPPAAVGAALLGTPAGPDRTPAPAPDIAAILKQVDHGASAGIQRVILDRPGTAGQIVRVDIYRPGRLVYGDRLFFAGNGTPTNPGGMLDSRAGLPFLNGLFAVHFGTFGGVALRIAYALLGVALCVSISSGIRIWLARRASRGRPLPALERLWTGLIWGSPLALLLSFIGADLGFAAEPIFAATLVIALMLAIGMVRRAR